MQDKDGSKQPAVLRFSDIIRGSNKKESEESSIKDDQDSDTKPSTEEMQSKIATAKIHANKEISIFEKATTHYLNIIEELVLFNELEEPIRNLLEEFLEEIVQPILNGRSSPYFHGEAYREFRTNMYKSLIQHYVDNE